MPQGAHIPSSWLLFQKQSLSALVCSFQTRALRVGYGELGLCVYGRLWFDEMLLLRGAHVSGGVFVLKLGSLNSRLRGDFAESVLVMLRCCGDDIGNRRCRCWLIYKKSGQQIPFNSVCFVLKSFALAKYGIVRESHLSLFAQVLQLNNFNIQAFLSLT